METAGWTLETDSVGRWESRSLCDLRDYSADFHGRDFGVSLESKVRNEKRQKGVGKPAVAL